MIESINAMPLATRACCGTRWGASSSSSRSQVEQQHNRAG
jgi:hypothetical protein